MRSTIAIETGLHSWFKRILAAIYAETGKELSIGSEIEKAVEARGAELLAEHQIELAAMPGYPVSEEG